MYSVEKEAKLLFRIRPLLCTVNMWAYGSEPCYYSLNNEGFIDADTVIELCLQEKPSLLIICNP